MFQLITDFMETLPGHRKATLLAGPELTQHRLDNGSQEMTNTTTTTNKILDAAVSCFQRHSIDKVTMSDIIAESQLARTTVYRHFPVKDDIISQMVLRDIDSLIQRLESIRSRYADQGLESQLLEVMDFTISEFCKRPLLAELFSQDPIRINRLGLSNDRVVEYSQQATHPTFGLIKASGRLRKGVVLEDFTDWCGRIIMSFAITPHRFQDSPQKMRLYIKNYIVPSLLTQV
jgi:AcrR family transcriptional regulator